MPGTNAGTGQPLWFICPHCRKRGDFYKRRAFREGFVPTGRTKPLARSQWGHGGCRVSTRARYEYRCLACRRTGWSRHKDVERAYERDFGVCAS